MYEGSERSGTSPEDVKPDDDKRQSNRACVRELTYQAYQQDFCHRMKMKCIGKEDPPCNRCRQSGQNCTFDGRRKSKAAKVEDRLKIVEEQMTAVQASLAELISTQRSGLAAGLGSAGPGEGSARHKGGRTTRTSDGSFPPTNPPFDSRPFHSPLSARQSQSQSQRKPAMFDTLGARDEAVLPAWDRPPSPPAADSAGQSDDEDDPLEPSAVMYNNMLNLAEAARLEADGQPHQVSRADHSNGDQRHTEDGKRTSKRPAAHHPFDFTVDGGPHKRPRRADDSILRRALPIQRGNLVHQFQNPIELGFCSSKKAKEVFDLFMDGASVYVPIFDPDVDTFENLCHNSPFTLTVLIMVGSKIEDAGGPPSELQKKCKDHAENIGMHTLFTPVANMDVLQAMIVLASWGDTSWRPGGHALRIAMDMGLYRCLPYLAASGMGTGKSEAELQEERQLVVGARCWLAIYKSEFEMAFNLGRPALVAAEDTLKHCRKFLDHPLSIITDSRLVYTCELLTLRLSMHQPFSIWPAATRIPDLDERIEQANESYAEWFAYWRDFYVAADIPRSNFLHESLYSQQAHALLHTNSRILHSVRSRRHVSLLSEKRKGMLVKALRSAETLVTMALRGASYASHFTKANYYTHVGVAFAARMIIRLTSLIPEHVKDIRQTGRDLEAVTKCLAEVPGFQFAQDIRNILVKARRKRVLPPSSKASSPTPATVALPPVGNPVGGRHHRDEGDGDGDVMWGSHNASPNHFGATSSPSTLRAVSTTSIHPAVDSFASPQETIPHDFVYAEQLFAGGISREFAPVYDTHESTSLIEPFNLDTWFPYPPLESEGSFGLSASESPAAQGTAWLAV